jgi:hypothetical protein
MRDFNINYDGGVNKHQLYISWCIYTPGAKMSYEIRQPGTTAWAENIRDLREARRLLGVARRVIDWNGLYKIYHINPKTGDRELIEEY